MITSFSISINKRNFLFKMDEYDPNIDLFEKIINAKSFADIGMEEKKILGCLKKIMKDLYYFKEKTL